MGALITLELVFPVAARAAFVRALAACVDAPSRAHCAALAHAATCAPLALDVRVEPALARAHFGDAGDVMGEEHDAPGVLGEFDARLHVGERDALFELTAATASLGEVAARSLRVRQVWCGLAARCTASVALVNRDDAHGTVWYPVERSLELAPFDVTSTRSIDAACGARSAAVHSG